MVEAMEVIAVGSVEEIPMRQLGLQEAILVGHQVQVRHTLHHSTRVQVLGQRVGDELLLGLIGSFDSIESKICSVRFCISEVFWPPQKN